MSASSLRRPHRRARCPAGSVLGVIDPIVGPEWLAANLGRDDVVVCDVRWYLDGRSGHDAYLDGHLPTAVWVNLDTVLAAPPSAAAGRHPLPTPDAFAAGLGAVGVSDTSVVVAYDDLGGMAAGRLVWLLRILGREAALLDGGLQGWAGPLQTVPIELAPVTFSAAPWPTTVFATADETGVAAADGSAIVIDARAPERYRGEVEPIDARPGHIPGAATAPFAANLVDGRFRTSAELRERFSALGVDEDTDVIAYCGSGVSACHNLLALEAAGFNPARARLYPGSWSQWASDRSRPAALD